MASIIYGPVSSWRLGRSLGVDVVSTSVNLCSFDCTYCQLGETVRSTARRRQFVNLGELAESIEKVRAIDIDYATFSGIAEPTLASNLGEAITLVKSKLKVPVAVLTNSSLIPREDVRRDLNLADVVVAKLDAPDESLFRQVNRPRIRITLEEIITALTLFRKEYRGKLALQMMFVDANKNSEAQMAWIAEVISPDEIQLNTPLRPCAVQPLSIEAMLRIKRAFTKFEDVKMVYEEPPPDVTPIDTGETSRRRPE